MLALLTTLFAPEAEAAPTTYTLDANKSWLYVVVYADPNRWTPITAHDHGISANEFTGTVVWDNDDPSTCNISISLPVTGLRVDPDGLRKREGLALDGGVGDGDKKTITKNMLGKKNLLGAQFPKISYQSSSCVARPDGRFDVTGNLTIRGKSRPITVQMKVTAGEGSFSASGKFHSKHADWGMSPFTYGPGTPKNLEKLKFVIDVVGS